MITSGNYGGDIAVSAVMDDGSLMKSYTMEGKAHCDTVRAMYWDPQSRYVITGGEDSRLCCWRRGDLAEIAPVAPPQAKKAPKLGKERGFTPY